jgi:hypothetical protein
MHLNGADFIGFPYAAAFAIMGLAVFTALESTVAIAWNGRILSRTRSGWPSITGNR